MDQKTYHGEIDPQELADVQPVICPKCGQILEYDDKFCTRCGTQIAQ